MNKFSTCTILIIFVAGLRAETTERTNAAKSALYKNINDQECLKDEYEALLLDLAENQLENYKMNVVLSSSNCLICRSILGTLMNASAQSFLTVLDVPSTNYSDVGNASGIVPDIGYYKSVILLIEDVSEFFEYFSQLQSMYAWNPRAQHLIFTVKKPNNEELEMIFKKCWSHKVLDIGVIVFNEKEAYTYNPYLKSGSEMCEKVDNWSKLFYDRLRNMNGYIITAKYLPFTGNDRAKWIEEEQRYAFLGPDFGYADAFFRSVNATPRFINLTDDLVPCYKNFSFRYRIWNERRFDDAELWMNFMVMGLKVQERIERSYPLRRDNFRILVPKSGSKIPSIFQPYNDITWTFLMLSLIAFFLYSSVFYKWRRIDDNAFFRTLGIFLGKNMAKRPYGALEKFTFFIFTMSSLLILSAYQGALYGALTNAPQYPEIDTLAELFERIRKINTYRAVVDYFKEFASQGIEVIEFSGGDYIEYMKEHRNEAYAFPNSIAQYTAKSKTLTENGIPLFHIMNKYSLPGFVAHTLPYGSPYLKKLEKIFLTCKEAGLSQFWEAEVKFYSILSGAFVPEVSEGRTLKKLSLDTQLDAFYIWSIGLMVSFICFVAELYFYRNIKKMLMSYKQVLERKR